MKGIKLLIILLITVSFTSVSISQTKEEKKANAAFYNGEFATAIDLFRTAYSKETSNVRKAKIVYHTALCYKYLNEPKSAELWFRKAIMVKYPDPEVVLFYADAKKMNNKFDEAIIEYKKYQKIAPDDPRGKIGVKSCELSAKWKAKPTRYKVDNMAFFNSRHGDFSPVYAKKDFKILYFSSNRAGSAGTSKSDITGAGFTDLWQTNKDRKGAWSEPVVVPGETINTPHDEGASSLNLKGSKLYFTRCKVEKNRNIGCKVYYASKKGVGWGEPTMVEIKGAGDSINVAHPAVSLNELTLYFTANMQGGYGGKDIWMVKRAKKNQPFGDPINLGPEINTPGNEVFPYIRKDDKLFFSSDYHPGMGGLDIFMAEKEKSGKYKITNLKYPLNSSADDFGIIYEGALERGFFTSSRKGGKGGDDIFEFYLPPIEFIVSGVVMNEKTEAPLQGAKVTLKGSDGSTEEAITEIDGSYKFKLKPNADYQLQSTLDKYLNGNGSASTKGIEEDKTFKVDIYMASTEVPIVLPNILYDLGKWNLRPESMPSLGVLVKTLNGNPNITIELRSHTDFRSSNESNLVLSQKRAQSVVDYLISKGIAADRLTPKGYGEEMPKEVGKDQAERYRFLTIGKKLDEEFIKGLSTVEEQETAHQINRRTEFKVLSTNYVPATEGGEETLPEDDEGN